jgi:uncharacterized membrane protein YqjE
MKREYSEPTHSQRDQQTTIGDLFLELTRETQLLFREEVALARKELQEKTSQASKGIGMILVGAVVAYTGVLSVIASLVLVLAIEIDLWISALLVGVIFVLIGASIMVYFKKKLVKESYAPKRTLASLDEDKEMLRHQIM